LLTTLVSKDYVDNILKSMADILIVVDPDATIKTVNQATLNLLGYEEQEIIGKPIELIVKEEEEEEEEGIFRGTGLQILIQKEFIEGIERTYQAKNGRKIPVLFSGSVMREKNGGIQGIVCMGQDITERKRAEEALRESEERFRKIVQEANAGYFFIDREGYYKEINNAWLTMHKFDSADEIIGHHFSETQSDSDLEQANKIVENLLNGVPVPSGEFSRLNNDDTLGYHHFTLSPVVKNAETIGLEGFLIDTSEKRQADEKVKANLKEKETLLQEIHHRVKNNMAVIDSLLNLQMKSTDNKIAQEALQDSQNRVQSMASVHETLYRSDTLSAINLKTYLSELGRKVFKNYSISSKIKFKVVAENIMVSVKQASPVGLIVNELIANCLKYAFTNDREGEILLELKPDNENGVELAVSDNGVGISDGFDLKTADSLGLKLVKMLVEIQLDGSIDMESNNGTKFTIKFNIET
jgi:PAS domain S-box-containing protein